MLKINRWARPILAVPIAFITILATRTPAQVIFNVTGTKNSGNHADEFTGPASNPRVQRSSVVTTGPCANCTMFSSRYSSIVTADADPGVGSSSETLNSDYSISFNVTAPASYRLIVDTRMIGDMTIIDDNGSSASAEVSAVTGSQDGSNLLSGSLGLSDPNDISCAGKACHVGINRTGSAVIVGSSFGATRSHTLRFTWAQTATSIVTSPSVGGNEAAIRLGGTSIDGKETAGDYPGSPIRTQADDGHFVSVRVIGANDECVTAQIAGGTSFSQTLTTDQATTAQTDPTHSCGLGTNTRGGHSVWYAYTAPGTGTLTASTAGSNYNTVLSVSAGPTAANGGCTQFQELQCNDDFAGGGSTSQLQVPTSPGVTYLFEVMAFGNTGGGTLQFTTNFVAAPTPPPTPTFTSNTATPTRTPSSTSSPTNTATFTPSPTETSTPTETPTSTETATPTQTSTPTQTPTPTQTSTPTQTPTPNVNLLGGTCNSSLELTYIGSPQPLASGATQRVRLALGAHDVLGGTAMTISGVALSLDCRERGCSNDPLQNCVVDDDCSGGATCVSLLDNCIDEGDVIGYAGNLTTDCVTTWSADISQSNEVILTADPPVILPPNTTPFCNVEFDVKALSAQGSDSSPSTVDQITRLHTGATCNNGLGAQSVQLGLVQLEASLSSLTPTPTPISGPLTCEGQLHLAYRNRTELPGQGDTVHAEIEIAAGSILGGENLTVPGIALAFDCRNRGCSNDTQRNCTTNADCTDGGQCLSLLPSCVDEGAIIGYVGNISSTCGVSWSTRAAGINEIVFVPEPLLLVGIDCSLQFDLQVLSPVGTDTTPARVEQTVAFEPYALCDNGLFAQSITSSGLLLATPTATPTNTLTPSETATGTPSPSATETLTPTPTETPLPSETPSFSATPETTDTAVSSTSTPSPLATETPSSTPSSTPTETPSSTLSPTETPTASDLPTATATETDTIAPTETPSASPTEVTATTPTESPTTSPSPTSSPTETATPPASATATAEATVTATAVPPCAGDCTGDGVVTVDEIVSLVNIALGTVDPSVCVAGDTNHDGQITVDEILTAVAGALNGCA